MQQALKLQSLESDWNITLKEVEREFNTPLKLLSYLIGDSAVTRNRTEPKWFNSADVQDIPETDDDFTCIANECPLNDYGKINSFLSSVNNSLSVGDYYISCVEPQHIRQELRFGNKSRWIRELLNFNDFIVHRVVPRTRLLGSIYFKITKGKGRVLSLSESLARLCYNGFSIENQVRIQNHVWLIAKKVREPLNGRGDQRMLLRLKRIGYQGKKVTIYKFRTMHPYSQYLQDYVYRNNDLDNNGKFRNDFRTTSWGSLFRKYWIDEFPMFINLFKGELKLVGVRPLSEQYFSLYPEDLQELRTKIKPGLVPPYYADMPNGLEEIQESERRYLEAYQKEPIKTDVIYFFKVFHNIFFKRARSR